MFFIAVGLLYAHAHVFTVQVQSWQVEAEVVGEASLPSVWTHWVLGGVILYQHLHTHLLLFFL